jgi:hypothetical protein
MGFAVDHPLECIIIIAIKNRITYAAQGTVLVLGHDHSITNGANKVRVPLGSETGSTRANILRDPVIAL